MNYIQFLKSHPKKATSSFDENLDYYSEMSHIQHINLRTSEIPVWYFNSLKKGASLREIYFNVSRLQLNELFIKQRGRCRLTDLPIWFMKTSTRRKLQTASLDRIDSNRGYDINNLQWVAKLLNKMKGTMPQELFITLCAKIGDTAKKDEILSKNLENNLNDLSHFKLLKPGRHYDAKTYSSDEPQTHLDVLQPHNSGVVSIEKFIIFISNSFKILKKIEVLPETDEIIFSHPAYLKKLVKITEDSIEELKELYELLLKQKDG